MVLHDYLQGMRYSMGAAGAQTRRSLEHHLLHPLILRLLVLCAPADFDTQSSPGYACTRRSKFLTHSLIWLVRVRLIIICIIKRFLNKRLRLRLGKKNRETALAVKFGIVSDVLLRPDYVARGHLYIT